MNNQEQQDDFLREHDFIRVSIMLKPVHADFLKTIDPDNVSKANRMVIDGYMRQSKISKLEHNLLLLMVFIILILGICQIWIL